MKNRMTFLIFIFSILGVNSQEIDSTIQLLKPLDWEFMSCGKSPIWKASEETLALVNKTNKSIQGYWIANTNQIRKQRKAFVKANQSAKFSVRAGEYWIICDSDKNASGVFQMSQGQNKIVITEADFEETRKLPISLIDHRISGTISGGQPIQEQMAYDVIQYDIKMEIFPDRRYIKASNTISAVVTQRLDYFVFDLDTLLNITDVYLIKEDANVDLTAKFLDGKYWCELPESYQKGKKLKVYIEYEGNPRISSHAPYQGGFSWNKTEDCQHWIATSCQIDGADLWFPCKDYQWDEPDAVKLTFTVPEGLKAVSNGVLTNTVINSNQTTTYTWEVNNPINNYCIALNVAPYIELKDKFESLYGDTIDIYYWFLPENELNAKQLYPNIKNYLDFIESTIGPYPFRNEKIGIVEVPFVGMEHQTVTAIAPNFTHKYPGYNYVLFHELCHDWFGNLVTAYDWNDFWIQEGLTGYVEALYEEFIQGDTGYKRKLEIRRKGVQNKFPLATDSIINSREGLRNLSYAKAVYLLHSLRYLIGKEDIVKVLRLMAYPSKELEHKTNGQQCRFVTTNDLFQTIEKVCGNNYDWFKDVYLYKAELPRLNVKQNENGVILSWETKDNLTFNMPLELKTEKGVQKIDFNNNVATLDISRAEILEFDPNKWILFNIEE